MKINSIFWKNFNSYGNTMNTITFPNDKGSLTLLTGVSGNGKSTIINAPDLAIYGQILNKQGKRLPQRNFPNRINGNLMVGIDFDTDTENYKIKRIMQNSSSSLTTELLIDNVKYNKANKIDGKILEAVGFDYKTFKNFISLDINNFKNFISLTPEEKRILLDKLFNLEVINDLNKILKQLQKNNDISFSSMNKEIAIYHENIQSLNDSITNVIIKTKNNKEDRLKELKKILTENKENFIALEEKKNEIQKNIDLGTEEYQNTKLKLRDINNDIISINEKIDLYRAGKCPTCQTELIGKLNLLPEYEERLTKTKKIQDEINKLSSNLYIELEKSKKEINKASNEFNDMFVYLSSIKSEQKKLKEEDDEVPINIDEFKENLEGLKVKLKDKETKYLDIQRLKHVYEILSPVWGEQGIKRDIIEAIIDPLNEYIKEDLSTLKMRFNVELDNNFDAHIFEWGQEIDPDTLSTGEAKRVNLIIMLAYVKMLRLKSNINVLFLDEVFAGLDGDSIELLVILFKKFADERGINIIITHQTEFKEYMFNKIISVNKSAFSYIEEKIIE